MTLVGKKFPDLEVGIIDHTAEFRKVNLLREAINQKKKVLLFWFPKAFTFVCPTELHAFQQDLPEFEKRNTIVVGASCDTKDVLLAWLDTSIDDGGIEGVKYPIVADSNRNLSSTLGILDGVEEYSEELDAYVRTGEYVAYRATYLIDEEGLVFHEGINHMPIGRNTHEYLRIIDAYKHFQEYGEVCPANWEEGKKALKADRDGIADYQASEIRDLYAKYGK